MNRQIPLLVTLFSVVSISTFLRANDLETTLNLLHEKEMIPSFEKIENSYNFCLDGDGMDCYQVDSLTSDFIQISVEGGTSTLYYQVKLLENKKSTLVYYSKNKLGFQNNTERSLWELDQSESSSLTKINGAELDVSWEAFGISMGKDLDKFPDVFCKLIWWETGIAKASIVISPTFDPSSRNVLETFYSEYPEYQNRILYFTWNSKKGKLVLQ